jgi:glycosyltransferase involved in cell wall biosynthesis
MARISTTTELRPPCDSATALSITAIILTFDEEIHIERCIKRLVPLAERIVVVDSFSHDRTVERAKALGAEIVQHPFKHQADQFQWALDTLDIRTEWVLRLDADEYLEPALIEEISVRLPSLPPAVTGVRLKRKLIFHDKWIRFGGYYPTVLLRLWRRGQASVQQLWMDEHIVLNDGDSIMLANAFCDHNLRDITWWTEKHNRYATRKMVDFIVMEQGLRATDDGATTSADASRALKRFLQYTVFRRTPIYLRAVLLFVYRYAFRLGFLDGKNGFIWHALQSFWYTMLIDVKVEEARGFIAAHGVDAFRAHLADRHGIIL